MPAITEFLGAAMAARLTAMISSSLLSKSGNRDWFGDSIADSFPRFLLYRWVIGLTDNQSILLESTEFHAISSPWVS
jgi:hypothetical protein